MSDDGADDTLPASGGAPTLPAPTLATGETAPAVLEAAKIDLPAVDASTYELREQLGAGGMGKVVVARDRRLGRLLAVKVAQTADPSLRSRFTREAVLTARLQHPSIIPVHEAGVWTGDEPFYAMKLVAGASLATLIARAKTLDERLALIPNVIAVVDALAYAHAQRVIHRDLKPDNVIVGEYGETIVIDWGLAKELDAEDEPPTGGSPYRFDAGQTVVGAAMGTPPYMPPEQAAGERVDERADVYGLGAMLYHVLSGAPPYRGANADEVMDQVLAGPPIALAARVDGIPADLLAIVDKAMAREPAERYPNAKHLADDLKRFERGQLVAAHAYSRGELVRRFIVKHRAVLGASLGAVIALGLAIGLWVRAELHDRAARSERIAELLRADDADEATTRAKLQGGKFTEAAETLARQTKRLADLEAVATQRRVRDEERDRVVRIAQFHEHARSSTFLTGDEDRGEAAIFEMYAALREVGALDAQLHVVTTPWWEKLFPQELTPAQQHDMQRAAYRTALNLAVMEFKAGALLLKMQLAFIQPSPEAVTHFARSLEILRLATPLEQALAINPARVTRIWQRMALYFIDKAGTPQDVATAGAGPLDPRTDLGRADNADDHDLLGVGHFIAWQQRDTALGQGMRIVFPELLDYAHPLETADRELRTAIRLDPKLYWPHFMLAMTLRAKHDFAGAELAADACVALEPTFMLGYGLRALMLAERAKVEADPKLRAELLARALADSDAQIAAQPDHPVSHWTRGELMQLLDRRADATAELIRAFELESNVLGKFTRQIAMGVLVKYIMAEPPDHDGYVLLAYMALASREFADAIDKATQALATPDARAYAIRGTAYVETQRLDLARPDLDAALKLAPDNALAALGRARLLERGSSAAETLAAYEALARIAVVQEHKLQAELGRARALTKLGRPRDAEAALRAAGLIDPTRDVPSSGHAGQAGELPDEKK